jgi:hypothetical protein
MFASSHENLRPQTQPSRFIVVMWAVRSWNKGTQSWLALYVGKRLPAKMGAQVGGRMSHVTRHTSHVTRHTSILTQLQSKKVIVMATSALWHGLYPGVRLLHGLRCGVLPVSRCAGYYCTFLLAAFWSEAEKKLFAAVAPFAKVCCLRL